MSSLNIHFSAYPIIVMIWIYYRYTFEFLLQHLYINENDCTCSHHVCILNMMERILQVKVLSSVTCYSFLIYDHYYYFSFHLFVLFHIDIHFPNLVLFNFFLLLDILMFVGGCFEWNTIIFAKTTHQYK